MFSCTSVSQNTNEQNKADTLAKIQQKAKTELAMQQAVLPSKQYGIIDLKAGVGNKTTDRYLADKNIPERFKKIFKGEVKSLTDDDQTLAIIDSLFSKDPGRYPFYFILFSRTRSWADGAFSEPIGVVSKKYVETNPKQFLQYFATEKTLTEVDFSTWATNVSAEISIESEENKIQGFNEFQKTMQHNCQNFSEADLLLMAKFIESVQIYLNQTK